MKAIGTSLDGVLVVESPVFSDDRGWFTEVFHREKFAALGLPEAFVQDNHSRSMQNVLRGLHYQLAAPQGKLVRVADGTIYDVAVDLRRSSPMFGKWTSTTLTAGDGRQLWIPPGYAHGFLVLSEYADVSYKCTSLYDPASERCIRWDDATLGITWPLALGAPRLSAKDAAAPAFADAEYFA